MIVHIIVEIVLFISIFFAANTFWQIIKRDKYLKIVLCNHELLEKLITIERLQAVVASNSIYLRENSVGYFVNIATLLESDKRTNKRIIVSSGLICILLLLASYYLGVTFFFINLLLSISVNFASLADSGRTNVYDHVVTLAAIFYKWRKEDSVKCDEWVASAKNLKGFYSIVQNAK